VELADIHTVAFADGGLLVGSVPVAATYAAHRRILLRLFAEIIRQLYTRTLSTSPHLYVAPRDVGTALRARLGPPVELAKDGGRAARGRQGSAVLGRRRYVESRRGQLGLDERCFQPQSQGCHSALLSFVFCNENDMCWTIRVGSL
jgi:hypothetical protein